MPKIGTILDYHASLRIRQDMPNATIQVEIPEGVEVVDGIPLWSGDLTEGETIELKMRLRVTQPGEWLIFTVVLARPIPEGTMTFGASNQTLLISDSDHGRIVDDADIEKTAMPCGADLSCGTPPSAAIRRSTQLHTCTISAPAPENLLYPVDPLSFLTP
jgi:hypothetical protein